MDEFGLELGKGEGDVGRLRHIHLEAHWNGFFLLRWWILIQEVMEHTCWALAEILDMVTLVFSRIATLQKVSLSNSTPCRCNQVRPKDLGSGKVVTVTDPVSIHTKYLDRGEDLVLKQVVKL